MKLREIIIKNFRCLLDITIPIADTTILVGENNSGKTALLDAIGIVLHQSTGRREPFSEYDYCMVTANDSPQTCDGIVIEVWFREDKPDEWPDSIIQALTDIVQTDPERDIDSVGLRLTSKYDAITQELASKWEFLALDGQPLGGKGALFGNLRRFLLYIKFYYLSSLRDSAHEFSPRSQFWGRILRDMKISEEQKKTLSEELGKLNEDLLKADPRLERVIATLDKGQDVMDQDAGQKTSIQAIPLRPWDLMSKAGVTIKARGGEIDFPLAQHGQGVQSLAIIFLFQAYIDVLLKPAFKPETEAILALEEPEAHLHPQATRALTAKLAGMNSQIIISSHSPYFIQEIPLTNIRLFRRDGPISKVLYIKRTFTAQIPSVDGLSELCTGVDKFDYHQSTSTFTANGEVDEKEYRDLLSLYPGQRDIHAKIKHLYLESQLFLSDPDLADLENYVKRIRGEVLFARSWLLCEGQCEYLLLRYFAELLETPLDEAGVSIIDFQNNGSPSAFVDLARAFEIPWILICDNDDKGKEFVEQVKNHELTEKEFEFLARLLPEPNTDLELYLFENGFAEEYKSILEGIARTSTKNLTELIIAKDSRDEGTETRRIIVEESCRIKVKREGESIVTILEDDPDFQTLFAEIIVTEWRKNKLRNVMALVEKLRTDGADSSRVPDFFALAIKDITTKVK